MGIALTIASVIIVAFGGLAFSGAKDSSTKKGSVYIIVGGILIMLGASVTVVPARSKGVVVSFGKVVGVEDSGLHMVRSWSSVEKYSSTINTLRLKGNKKNDDNDGVCVTVRLSNQTTACIDLTVQWQLSTDDNKAIETLYIRWKSFDKIEPNLIRPQTEHAVLKPFSEYDPLRVLNGDDAPSLTMADLEKKTKDNLQHDVGSGITITVVTFNMVHYDPVTQDKLNSYAQSLADTRIAEQRKKTAEAQKAANDMLASNSLTELVVKQNCLDMTERLAKEGKTLSTAWTCSGSSNPLAVTAK